MRLPMEQKMLRTTGYLLLQTMRYLILQHKGVQTALHLNMNRRVLGLQPQMASKPRRRERRSIGKKAFYGSRK
jgi:hypothetical protein